MSQPTLFLMVGYPGSGKTTTSHVIHELTGATHIWADRERRKMFSEPTHSRSESHQLYRELNKQTDELLAAGRSVIFDTNFNFRRDRDHLRQIAATHGARTILVWVRVDKELARSRAQHPRHASTNLYSYTIPTADFERMSNHLQPPDDDEFPVILDGTKITREYVASELKLA